MTDDQPDIPAGPVLEARGLYDVYRGREVETVALRGTDISLSGGLLDEPDGAVRQRQEHAAARPCGSCSPRPRAGAAWTARTSPGCGRRAGPAPARAGRRRAPAGQPPSLPRRRRTTSPSRCGSTAAPAVDPRAGRRPARRVGLAHRRRHRPVQSVRRGGPTGGARRRPRPGRAVLLGGRADRGTRRGHAGTGAGSARGGAGPTTASRC